MRVTVPWTVLTTLRPCELRVAVDANPQDVSRSSQVECAPAQYALARLVVVLVITNSALHLALLDICCDCFPPIMPQWHVSAVPTPTASPVTLYRRIRKRRWNMTSRTSITWWVYRGVHVVTCGSSRGSNIPSPPPSPVLSTLDILSKMTETPRMLWFIFELMTEMSPAKRYIS